MQRAGRGTPRKFTATFSDGLSMRILWLPLVLLIACPAFAAVLPEGTGLMYDSKYCFWMTAPKGWNLDNNSQNTGVCAVFYPIGSSWGNSDVVFYVNTRAKTASIQTPIDAVKDDMADMHSKGSPHSRAEKIKEIRLKHERTAEIWQYTGDRWGNFECTAFVVEKEGISCVFMSARTKNEMDGAIPAFERLVASYDFIGKATISN